MDYYLGIDGGGTKTEAILADRTGRILGMGRSGGSNPNFVGKKKAFQSILEAIRLTLCELDPKIISHVAICIPGIKKYQQGIISLLPFDKERLTISTDELSTFYSALLKEYGVVVLAGTGSFVLGINKRGVKASVGGWGPIIGDWGSGYWIGREALKSVVQEHDGMGSRTLLTEKIINYYGIESINCLRSVLVPDKVSQLASLVYEEALEGDAVALSIINRAADHLGKMAEYVIKKLDMDNVEYDLSLTGGISKLGDLLCQSFQEGLSKTCPFINIIKPRCIPVIGALLLAMKEKGIVWEEDVITKLIISYRRGEHAD